MRVLRLEKDGTLVIASDNYELEQVKRVVVSGGRKDKEFEERVIRWKTRREAQSGKDD